MGRSNKEIVLAYYDEVINGKDLEAFPKYYSDDYIARIAPYVGMGVFFDNTQEDKLVIQSIAEGGPSEGKLREGDVILAATDEHGTYETLEDLKNGNWGYGLIGGSVILAILRDGEHQEVEIIRGKVEGFPLTFGELLDNWKHYLSEDCPDLHEEVVHILEEGDTVAVYTEAMGTISEFNRQAIWTTCMIYRLKDGKIIEDWGVGPGLNYFTQLGYKILRPDRE